MTVNGYLEHPVVDEQGAPIGQVVDVVFDRATDHPRWVVVKPGRLRRCRYVPVDRAHHTDDGRIVVPYRKDVVMDAPAASSEHVLSDDDEHRLLAHYGR